MEATAVFQTPKGCDKKTKGFPTKEAAGISRPGSTPVFRTVAVAQMVEQRIVIPPVGGSKPLGHPDLLPWSNWQRHPV